MLRRPFALVSAVSLLLFLATMVLWGRSYWVSATYDWSRPGGDPATVRWVQVYSGSGVAGVGWARVKYLHPDAASAAKHLRRTLTGWVSFDLDEPAAAWAASWAEPWPQSHAFNRRDATRTSEQTFVQLPYWMPALLTLVLPACWLLRSGRRRRRQRHGRCPACGYDLRATPEQGGALLDRCPECGAAPAAKPS